VNYHDLKILHIFFAVVTLSMSTALFYGGTTKFRQIINGLSCLLLLGTGFAIMGRFGLSHAGPYPTWIKVKIAMWVVLTIATPIVAKRFPEKAPRLFWPWMIIALIAVAMAVWKPMT